MCFFPKTGKNNELGWSPHGEFRHVENNFIHSIKQERRTTKNFPVGELLGPQAIYWFFHPAFSHVVCATREL